MKGQYYEQEIKAYRHCNTDCYICVHVFRLLGYKTDEQARYMRVYGTIYNDGELIVTENAVLSFLQYSDMSTIALCGQSNCDHSNAVTEDGLPCLAYGKQTLPFCITKSFTGSRIDTKPKTEKQ